MIPIALLEKFGCLKIFISRVEVRDMIADSSKPNKLRNVHHKKHDKERHHPKRENLLFQNQTHRAYHIF